MGGTGGTGHHITPMGFTQTLYKNIHQQQLIMVLIILVTSANTPFWNISTAIVIFVGRFLPMGLMLAIAGSFTRKR